MKRNNILILVTILSILLAGACASVGYPTGGEKDTTPPVLLQAEPADKTINFQDKEIRLRFDEFIALKDINNELLISPPTNKKVDVKIYGKSLRVTFNQEDTLKPNTTYHLSFGNGIADNNEGNILQDFSYVFSTGNYLDSMFVEGQIINAFTLEPEKGIIVGLYKNSYDSIVAKEKPYYVARTDTMGMFKFKYLHSDDYQLFALKDMNSNMRYDLPTEEIAFTEKEIVLQVFPLFPEPKIDSLGNSIKDSISNIIDSISKEPKKNKFVYKLRLFPTPDEKQRIVYAEFLDKKNQHLLLAAKKPMEKPHFRILSSFLVGEYFTELSVKKDTLHIWFSDLPSDSTLLMEVSDADRVLDTLKLRLSSFVKTEQKTDDTIHKKEPLAIKPSFTSKTPFYQTLDLDFDAPLQRMDSLQAVKIFYSSDTLYPSIALAENSKRIVHIYFPLADKADSTIQIQVIGGKFTDIYGLTNDTATFTTTVQGREQFGNIFLNFVVPNPKGQYIVQLLSDKNIFLQEQITAGSQKITFANLVPANYRIKVIEDKNSNNRWDTGDYWARKQAEKVFFLPKILTVKANWDLEEDISWDENAE